MRNLFLAAVFAVLVGCATTGGYEKILTEWVGQPEGHLVEKWGPPASVYEADGAKYLTYVNAQTYSSPGIVSGNVIINSGSTYTYGCKTTFEVRDGHIVRWRYEGNTCRA